MKVFTATAARFGGRVKTFTLVILAENEGRARELTEQFLGLYSQVGNQSRIHSIGPRNLGTKPGRGDEIWMWDGERWFEL